MLSPPKSQIYRHKKSVRNCPYSSNHRLWKTFIEMNNYNHPRRICFGRNTARVPKKRRGNRMRGYTYRGRSCGYILRL